VLTTFYSYGDVPVRRQGELIQGLGKSQQPSMTVVDDLAEALLRKMRASDSIATARTAI
jgi:hypothetical protein